MSLRTLVILLVSAGCQAILSPLPDNRSVLDGPVEGLSAEENRQHLAGDRAFNDQVFTTGSGLGPVFVTSSCGSCHAGDGKGHPFSTLTRFGQSEPGGNNFLSMGGPQLQNRAIPGFQPEMLPAGAPFARFTPPANTGLGFLAALSDQQILSNADPLDVDGDGISGIPNYISPPWYFQPLSIHEEINGKYIGRFGKKASAVDLLHQTVNAYNQDIGITSVFNPVDPYSGLASGPEVTENTIRDVVFYLRTLKAPVQRDANDAAVGHGKELFLESGCGKCHIPEWKTPQNDIPALSEKLFYPYTDLLLHDMGPGLDDGYTEGTAYSPEWRTPPLWGLGLAPHSQGGDYFLLHDGRAHSIDEAIRMHGGEGDAAKNEFEQMTEEQKKDLIRFLESL